MRLGGLALLFVASCTHLAGDYDPTPERDATIKLTLSAPACEVGDVTLPYDIAYSVDTAGEMMVEVDRPDGTSASVANRAVTSGEKGSLTLPAAAFQPGKNTIVLWVYAFKKVSSTAKLSVDMRAPIAGASPVDADGDCYSPYLGDCDDTNPAIHPGAVEICNDHIDNDCNGLIDAADPQCAATCADVDHDGYISTKCGGDDCDDNNAAINPAAPDICDGIDNNCNGKIDEDEDTDGDGFSSCPGEVVTVSGAPCPAGFTTCSDCNDSDPTTFPGGSPFCDAQGKLHSCEPDTDCIPTTTCASGVADPTAPVLFFTDITSGPNGIDADPRTVLTGGLDNQGVFITLYGLRFGASRGTSTVKLNGVEVASYTRWNGDPTTGSDPTTRTARELETITVQPGIATSSGNLVVTVNGKDSNPLPFTVRPGTIYFVNPNSFDGPGGPSQPFASVSEARAIAQPGDIIYLHAGAYNTNDSTAPYAVFVNTTSGSTGGSTTTCRNAYVNLFLGASNAKAGTPGAPIAYVGYPGDPPTIGGVFGSAGNSDFAIWLDDGQFQYPAPGGTPPYPCPPAGPAAPVTPSTLDDYVIANIIFQNTSHPIAFSGNGRRIVGNKFINIASYQFQTLSTQPGASNVQFLGNTFSRTNGDTIVGWDASGLEVGWNEFNHEAGRCVLADGYGCSVPASNVQVHDNLMNSPGTGISVGESCSGITGSNAYNNVIVTPGVAFILGNATAFAFENNTIFLAGTGASVLGFALNVSGPGTAKRFTVNNNIIYADDGQTEYYPFVNLGSGVPVPSFVDTGAYTGKNNLYFNIPLSSDNSAPWLPDPTTALYGDPLWVDPALSVDPNDGNFYFDPKSPARNHGATSSHCADYYGIIRPQGNAVDIGAIEFH